MLAVNLIILFVGSFKAIRKREIQRDSYRERLTPKFKVEKIIAQRTETENRNIVSIYLQVVPECLSDSPVYECQARMLLVSKQDGNEKWIPTEMNSPLKVGWDYYGYEPLTIQKGIAQRLDICYWDNRFVAVVPTVDPLPSKWRSIIGPGPFKFDIRMTAKDCSPVDFSVIVNLLGRKWDDPEYFIDLGGS